MSWIRRIGTGSAVLALTMTGVVGVTASASETPDPQAEVVIAGAGDICGSNCDDTANAIEAIAPVAVFTTGDNAYNSGTLSEFRTKYDPYWGRFKAKTHPSPGNHEHQTPGASGYYDYFGAAAGERGKGYYSYDLGDWHLVALNSSIPMGAGSAQEQWLRADLQANTKGCTVAYWHHPRFSRGDHGSSTAPSALWRALQDNRADLILVGHDHNYQRYARQNADGDQDPNGPRQIVIGTGGAGLYAFNQTAPNYETGTTSTHGVLKLTLKATGYDWEFVPTGGSYTDKGSGDCLEANAGTVTCDLTDKHLATYPALAAGATGGAVNAAQCLLGRTPNGTYDQATVDAVKAFQQGKGLSQTGNVDARTWTALLSAGDRPTLRTGANSAAVSRLQSALTAALGRTIEADGIFGTATDTAVRDYQRSRGLGVDGIVGSATWTALQAGK